MREHILAIDASLSSTGWAVLDSNSMDVVELGKITTTTGTKKKPITEDERIMTIVRALLDICNRQNTVSHIVMEDGYVGTNVKTGMQLCKLRGAIMMGFAMEGFNTFYMAPSQIRHELLGDKKGNAKKEEVAQGVLNLYKYNIHVQSLGPFDDTSNKAKNSDMYDAVSIGAAYILAKKRAGNAQTA